MWTEPILGLYPPEGVPAVPQLVHLWEVSLGRCHLSGSLTPPFSSLASLLCVCPPAVTDVPVARI